MPKEIPMRISHPAALLALALSIPLFAGCDRNPAPSPSQNTASAAADQTVKPWQTVIDEFIDGYFARYPTDAASAGKHQYDGKLPDWSAEGIRSVIAWLHAERDRIASYGDDKLDATRRFQREYALAVDRKSTLLNSSH